MVKKFELPKPGHKFSSEYEEWIIDKYQSQILDIIEIYPEFNYHLPVEEMNSTRKRDFEEFKATHPDVAATVPKKRARKTTS